MNNTENPTTILSDKEVRLTAAGMAEQMPQRNNNGERIADLEVPLWVNGTLSDEEFAEPKNKAFNNRRTFMLLAKNQMMKVPNRQPSEEIMGYLHATMGGMQTIEDLIQQLG